MPVRSTTSGNPGGTGAGHGPRTSVTVSTGETRVASRGELVTRTLEPAAVTIDVQRQPGARADVDEGHLLSVSMRRRQRGHQSGTAAHLVHLVAVGGRQLEQPIVMFE